MSPKELVLKWVEFFNTSDIKSLAELYHHEATNYQVANDPVIGRQNILKMFEKEFNQATMECIVENIFQDGEWAILEWIDPNGLRGCGFFHIVNDKIVYQRGYWDKLTFLKKHNLPIPG